MTMIQNLVREQVQEAIHSFLGTTKTKAKNGRRRRRGKWRPGGPGRPPKGAQMLGTVGQKHSKRTKPRRRTAKKASPAEKS